MRIPPNQHDAQTAATVRDLIFVGLALDLIRGSILIPQSSNLPAAIIILLLVKILAVELIPFLLLQRGRVSAAAWSLVGNATLIISFYIVISSGIRSSGLLLQVAVSGFAIVILGRPGLIVGAAATALALALAVLDLRGWRPPVLFDESIYAIATNVLGALGFAAIPLLRATARMRRLSAHRDELLQEMTSEQQRLVSVQQALRDSETLFRGISESSPAGVFRTNSSGQCIYANPRLLEIWGLSWDEFKGQGIVSRIHADDASAALAEVSAAHAERRSCFAEYRLSRPDGVRWVTARSSPITNTRGEYDGEVGTVVDTTEAVQLNQLLREKEAYMRTILNSEPECVKTIDSAGRLVEMNPAGLLMVEAESEAQVVGAYAADLVSPVHRAAFIDLHRRAIAGESGIMEHQITGLRGTVRWLEAHAAPLRNNAGKVIAAVAVSRDISDRKAREESQRRLELVQATAHIGLWDRDPRSPATMANSENLRMFGFPPDSTPSAAEYWERVHPDDRTHVQQALDAALAGTAEFETEYRVVLPDHSERWIFSKADVIRDAFGTATRIVGVNQDITARKLREQHLRDSEESFRTLFDHAPYGVVLMDGKDLSIVGFNELIHKQLGYTREEFSKLTLWDIDTHMTEQEVRAAGRAANRNPPTEFETRHRTKNGEIRDVLVTAAPVRIGGRALVYSAVQDITLRKRAEKELQASEARQRILAELSGNLWVRQDDPIAVLASSVRRLESSFADVCAARLRSDDGSCLLPPSVAFGGSAQVGTVHDIFSKPLPLSEPHFHQEVVRSGRPQFLPFVNPDQLAANFSPEHREIIRGLRTHSLIAVPLRAGDQPIGVLTVARHRPELPAFTEHDFSFIQELADRAALAFAAAKLTVDLRAELAQRRAMEKERDLMLAELQQLTKHLESAREDERKRISREIHDELGQQLTGLKMRLDFLFRAPLSPEQRDEQKQSVNNELETAIRTVRNIAAELRPGVLDSLGPAAALEWLARDFEDKFGIPCKTAIQPFPSDDHVATTLFRVAQEALTNAAKHASASSVWLNCYQRSGSIWLEIGDTGVGIAETDLHKSDRFGLIGMRERAALAGGSLTVTRGDSGGTQLRLELPVAAKERNHALSNRG